jgi:rhodanese-related sulfurtransferase
MKTRGLWGLVILALLLAPLATALAAPPEGKLIEAATLKGMLGDPQVMIIDVRVPSAYADSDKTIKGAVHQDPGKVPTWAQTLPKDKKIVLYCS